MTTPTNTSLSNEHYTPVDIVERARRVLERIDLDPATCSAANEIVRAETGYGPDMGKGDGLFRAWSGRVFLNPPGGKLDPETFLPSTKPRALSSAAVWWGKLANDWESGFVHSAIFVAFNTGVFRTAQGLGGVRAPQSFPWCMPRERIAFDVVGEDGIRRSGKSPPQDSAIVFVPPRAGDWEQAIARFVDEFSPLGYVSR